MLKFFRDPKFWSDKNSRLAKALEPLSRVYSFISNAKINSVAPEKVKVPVICAGNIVLGGAGKTPTVELICDILKANSLNPHILTSGYGGYLKNVVRVDPTLHSYLQVGDESLLLAKVAPTWIGKNRVHSGRAAVSAGADVIVMDDGLQNNSIEKNFKILVVDSIQGFANEYLLPAGPLRESISTGVRKSDVVLIIGEKNQKIEDKIKSINPNIPIHYARMKIVDFAKVENNKVLGFCGLGFPSKFKKTLEECGYEIIDFVIFPDHHSYTITEIQKLINAAKRAGATLTTTMKDYVKIPKVFRNDISVVRVKLKLEDDDLQKTLLKLLLQKHASETK
ncbi:MAG: tetraacyldisaccharide 4'-kinase [Holosporales bacterium]|nr:tetraacyldisaccharide 4'-kinase [Holosporales bacterium]